MSLCIFIHFLQLLKFKVRLIVHVGGGRDALWDFSVYFTLYFRSFLPFTLLKQQARQKSLGINDV